MSAAASLLTSRLGRLAAWAVVLLALLGTFALYHRPGFLVNLAERLWSCF